MTLPLTRRAALSLMAAATGTAAIAQEATPEAGAPGIQQFTLGDPNAPIEIVEYASFTCPHCARFHADVWPDLKANYIDTGKVYFIFRPVYFDGPGLWADMLARCPADNDKFFEISGILFERQPEWSRAETQAGVAEGIISVGLQAGLEEADILACLQDNDTAQALVADFQINAERDQINATPSFMIDGVLTENMSYPAFVQLLEAKLASR